MFTEHGIVWVTGLGGIVWVTHSLAVILSSAGISVESVQSARVRLSALPPVSTAVALSDARDPLSQFRKGWCASIGLGSVARC